jgi:hypothetical protein
MSIEDELMEEALNGPSKYYTMTITDTKTGRVYTVDQTLDSNINGEIEDLNRIINAIATGRDYLRGKTYTQVFGTQELKRAKLGDFVFEFNGVSGEKAFKLLYRFFNVFINSLDSVGALRWGSEARVES